MKYLLHNSHVLTKDLPCVSSFNLYNTLWNKYISIYIYKYSYYPYFENLWKVRHKADNTVRKVVARTQSQGS